MQAKTTISRRLSTGFIIIVVTLLAIAISSFIEFRVVSNNDYEKMELHEYNEHIGGIKEQIKDVIMAPNDYIITGNEKYINNYNRDYKKLMVIFKEAEEMANEEAADHDEGVHNDLKKSFANLTPRIEGLNQVALKIFEIKEPIGSRKAADLMEQLDYKHANYINNQLELADNRVKKLIDKTHQEGDSKVRNIFYFILFLAFGGVGISTAVSVSTSGSVTRSLKEMASTISSASSEILSASEQQASGSSEQAASVSETTATIEQLDQTAKQIASNAEAVVSVAENTLQSAKEGKDAIDDNMSKMEEIKESAKSSSDQIMALGAKSQEIGQVLGIINNIAEQTNLLALNASIEAARAGEAGKGFQVVASEIRKLAENVIDSTSAIKDIISELQVSTNKAVMSTEQSMIGMEKGVDLSQKAGEMLYKILQMVEETTNAAKQISVATRQQRSASEQVVTAMKEVAEVSRQSASASKQTTITIEDLNKLAIDLQKMIGKN